MKLPAMCVAGLPLLLLLSGCTHKTHQAQVQQPALAPPIVDTPPPEKTPAPSDLPPPVVTTPKPAPPDTTTSTQPPPPKPKHKRPAPKPADQGGQPTQTASNATNNGTGGSSESAIGQLSTGDPGDERTQTQNSIDSIEKSLHDIGRKLSDQEQKSADKIEEYLKEAKKALTTGDLDGAHTLTAKAKVLLGELTK